MNNPDVTAKPETPAASTPAIAWALTVDELDKIIEAMHAGLACANVATHNATYHKRVIHEALPILYSLREVAPNAALCDGEKET